MIIVQSPYCRQVRSSVLARSIRPAAKGREGNTEVGGNCDTRRCDTLPGCPEVMFVAADSGARPGVAGTIGAVGVDVQRWNSALDDLPRDYHLLHALEAR